MNQNRARKPARSRFHKLWDLAPEITFLNHGSFGACPKPILNLQAELRRQMEAEPVQFLWRRYEERLEPAREAVARFVGARARDLVFVTNATSGVNAVLRSLKLRRGQEILTTNHAYNACQNVVLEAARAAGARVVVARIPFPLRSAEEAVEGILVAVTKRTRLAMIDHVTSATALVLPVGQITRELQARGVEVLVDGAHAPGMVPLNVSRLGPSYYTANLHKWVCSPKGTAFLWVRADKQAPIQPAVISHGNNTHRLGYTAFQDRFDWAGTADPSGWFCAGAAIEWLGRLLPSGWPELRQRNHRLAIEARRLLCRKFEVPAPCPENMLGSMATVPLPKRFQGKPRSGRIDPEQLRLYDEFGIEVPFYRFGPPGHRFLRISAQVYNELDDYRYLAQAIGELA